MNIVSSHGGENDVTAHVNTCNRHKDMAKVASRSRSVSSFFRPQTQQSTIKAETIWSMFTAKHNLAFLNSDHATKMFREMIPDSEIAKTFACGRTKTTAIVKEALAPYYHKKMVDNMSNPFSILMDESNDKVDKSSIILVKVLDPEVGDVKTRFLDMPVVNIGTARNLFRALKESLTKYSLDFSNAMAFMSDTANVMKGSRSGVQNLADLTIKAGLEVLPINFSLIIFTIVASNVAVTLFFCHPQTFWLSLLRCVGRYLNQLQGLISCFLSCDEQSSKVISITERLQNTYMQLILQFLEYVLPCMDRFNRIFQKSTENTTCELYHEMNRLVRLYAANLLTNDTILEATDNLTLLNFDSSSQLSDENLGIGDSSWLHVAEVEAEHDTKPFFTAVRKFYVATIKRNFHLGIRFFKI